MSRWSAVVVCCWRVSECQGGVLLEGECRGGG